MSRELIVQSIPLRILPLGKSDGHESTCLWCDLHGLVGKIVHLLRQGFWLAMLCMHAHMHTSHTRWRMGKGKAIGNTERTWQYHRGQDDYKKLLTKTLQCYQKCIRKDQINFKTNYCLDTTQIGNSFQIIFLYGGFPACGALITAIIQIQKWWIFN